ncbi:phosphatidylinositol N-acetylglucosaminyltransferase-domain-containing protein [Kalaharituber pfeilii]|nr:phosphatidylinositol N-acetylglucosaminyltransferase-domain-containing protein [Kalaharituber pfeilii]
MSLVHFAKAHELPLVICSSAMIGRIASSPSNLCYSPRSFFLHPTALFHPMAGSSGAHQRAVQGLAAEAGHPSSSEAGSSVVRSSIGGGGGSHARAVSRNHSSRRKPWRKLLWVKQNYPDNWVDSSFLNQLQRNINVHPYDFWPLVAESTVITQHLSSVVIFLTCFIAIFTERVSPVVVAGTSSALTVLGYWVWDMGWEIRELATTKRGRSQEPRVNPVSTVNTPSHSPTRKGSKARQCTPLSTKTLSSRTNSPNRGPGSSLSHTKRQSVDLHLQVPPSGPLGVTSTSPSPELHTPIPRYQYALSLDAPSRPSSTIPHTNSSKRNTPSKPANGKQKQPQGKLSTGPEYNRVSRNNSTKPSTGKGKGGKHTRNNSSSVMEVQDHNYRRQQQRLRRLRTAKSAILIYCTLLGLSPILRSLTESISSDSIWAISSWLFIANCLTFDYGSGVTVKFPASLPTNAAIMASVVLASRLPTTTHVFSLVLFSIEVFGLFPVFRRYLRHISWYGHVALTIILVGGAAIGLGLMVGWGWAWGWVGLMGPGIMGGCSWWLMWLQRYKNEIHGPWDPAKPVIRRQWEG